MAPDISATPEQPDGIAGPPEIPHRTCLGDRNDPEVAATRRWMAELILALRRGDLELTNSLHLHNVTYSAVTARAILSAAQRHSVSVVLGGKIVGDLNLNRSYALHLIVSAEIEGNLSVGLAGTVHFGLHLSWVAHVHGDVTIDGTIGVSLQLGYVKVRDSGFTITMPARVDGNVTVAHTASVGAHVEVTANISGRLDMGGEVGGYLAIFKQIEKDVSIRGSVAGGVIVHRSAELRADLDMLGESATSQVAINGNVAGSVRLAGSVDADVRVDEWARVGGDLRLLRTGTVGGDFVVLGLIDGGVRFGGAIDGRTILAPRDGFYGPVVRLLTVKGARFGDEVFVGDGVSIKECNFRQNPDLHKFHLVGRHLLPDGTQRLANSPFGETNPLAHAELATVYRQLRTNLEKRGNRPGASLFYRGEMDERLRAALYGEPVRYAEAFMLAAYRAMSGYGLRASRALGWFVILALTGAFFYSTTKPDFDPYSTRDALDAWATIQFSFESMLGILRPPGDQLGVPGRWLQIAQRIVGLVLITQAALAIRDRVAR